MPASASDIPIQAPLKSASYTLQEIDEQLQFIGQLLKYSEGRDRKILVRKANEWLDRRCTIHQT